MLKILSSTLTYFMVSLYKKIVVHVLYFMIILITELKSYYCECLPYITNQTRNHKDTAPSILEEIASEISAQLEWENEWNSQGLASRLSEQVYPYKLCRILVMIKSCNCLVSLASA